MTPPALPIAIHPGALLVTASATLLIEDLNAALAPHGLCLPIFPLVPGRSLAELVARNAGGRRMLRYGPIGRYLRAATLEAGAATTLVAGGPIIKHATGYGLHRALAGGALDPGTPRELTFSLRPLPVAREARLLRCADLPTACRLAAHLLAEGLALSALAVSDAGDAGLLLAELEGRPAVLARQTALIERVAAATVARCVAEPAPWAHWEQLAAGGADVALSLPRAALPAFVDEARALACRYRATLTLWGDAGVGRLCLRAATTHPGEAAQLVALLRARAAAAGGSPATEEGPAAAPVWRFAPGQTPAPSPPAPVLEGARRAAFLETLAAVVGPRYVLTRSEALACYETDASIARPGGAPLAVALPATTAEVAALVRQAAAHGVPVVTRG
ncbi:MAG: FAD-binding oxidoreductase, partial [Chloroflexaceae bacterium]